ncbi:MAG: nucleoside monophosphate kinase [Clostridia bacterium]|nr:nucleoside monophosphate kinase [Clostridia bacterium]
MKILLLGQITCGKGTLSENLAEKYGYQGISIGQLLRDETAKDTEEAKIILDYQQRGVLVPNDITLKVLKNFLKSVGDKNLIFDGYPRNLDQAKDLEAITDLDAVFVLEVKDEIVMYRAMGRRCCKDCGAITHIDLLNGGDKCLKCGGELYIRNDATEEATKAKMESYYKDTLPLIDFYKGKYPMYFIDANQNPQHTLSQVEEILNKIK